MFNIGYSIVGGADVIEIISFINLSVYLLWNGLFPVDYYEFILYIFENIGIYKMVF